MDYQLKTSFEAEPEFAAYLNERINEFNYQHSPPHNQARAEGAITPVRIMVVDSAGQWQGGISADLYWNWLELKDFWLSETLRGQGLGSSVLAQIEQIGRERGASKVLLTTFEFQARTFYERHGYKVVGMIEDYPPGSSYYTMVKVL
ncbi:GNAT family N-acetyltransferase [Ktedonosporobacter rubrisoli]|uniref:GNAT family N-acetyltransferase n=1 Tax=Ktedonosporobacter rubrisoli TaxID=2509675 RepID=A0A4P6K1F8_KTERU|nr:GNAT family N-acetyltransferase [Ktedonosporobacter rubrisoli]QBD81296.1 GNAT family N-acetyltransferase [Ktedonosporobacter rubrisoli]